ncbi:putative transposase [Gordonia effusa NBRC 100432]|uniref:Putative transposase n=1 Tax=Gordonia effusa NBRC 100432 TaxID=1077974 RepID=H0R4H9_9ACTN|nr:IS110 family transposase [Gordonia effusa]GAB19980.1 putative transposase [Gordonia effusa NBRC 100432]
MTSMTAHSHLMQPPITFAGIDTHKHTHHVAVIDADGRLIADRQFGTTHAQYLQIQRWLAHWHLRSIGIEQTGTYGAAVTNVLASAGYRIIDVNHPDLSVRAREGKSDPIDAVMAANAVRTGRCQVIAKDRTGQLEALRFYCAARTSAVKARSAALTQIAALAITVDPKLRERLGTTSRDIVTCARTLRPDTTRPHDPIQAAKTALRALATRITDLDTEIKSHDRALTEIITPLAPRLLALPQVGIHIAAQLLLTIGQCPNRITTDAQFARLTGVAPINASSGRTNRHRLHRGGNRQANRAIHLIAIGRLKHHQPAIDYYHRRTSNNLSKTDTIRAMKRHIAREVFGALKADLTTHKTTIDTP